MTGQRTARDPAEQFFKLHDLMVDAGGEDSRAGAIDAESAPPSQGDQQVIAWIDGLRSQLDALGIDIRAFMPGGADRGQAASRKAVDRFLVEGLIGYGGCGAVFQAFDPKLERHVALKMPLPSLLVDGNLGRFIFEAKAAARLSHPNIVVIYEASDGPGMAYIVSELCKGPSLASWLRHQVVPVAPLVAAELVAQIAEGVHHAHCAGLLHRDIKPSNVLLFAKPGAVAGDPFPFLPKLTDFGLAKSIAEQTERTNSLRPLGTMQYMAPEQAQGNRADIGPACDIYSLGMVFYELLAGCNPYSELTAAELFQAIVQRPAPELPATVSDDLRAICRKCLAKRPSDRYATAAELAADLRGVLSGHPAAASGVHHQRRPVLAALAVIMLLGLGLLASWRESRGRADSAASGVMPVVRAPQNSIFTASDETPSDLAIFLGNVMRWPQEPALVHPLAQCLGKELDRLESINGPQGEVVSSSTLPLIVISASDDHRANLDHVYMLVHLGVPVPWTEASRLANELRYRDVAGHLATFESDNERNAVLNPLLDNPRFDNGGVWLGAADRAGDGQFRWVTGVAVENAPWDGPIQKSASHKQQYLSANRTPSGWRWKPNDDQQELPYDGWPTMVLIEFEIPASVSNEKRTRQLVNQLGGELHERMARFDARMRETMDAECYLELARGEGETAEAPFEDVEISRRRAAVLARLDSLRSAFPQFFCEMEPNRFAAESFRRGILLPLAGKLGVPRDAKSIYFNPPLGTAMILKPDPTYDSLLRRFHQGIKQPAGSDVATAAAPATTITAGLVASADAAGQGQLLRPAMFPPSHDPATESSECLFLILTDPTLGAPELDAALKGFVADTDKDGLPEFVDAWHHPLRFIRWPTDYYAFLTEALPAMRSEKGEPTREPGRALDPREATFPFTAGEMALLYERAWFDPSRWRHFSPAFVTRQPNPDALQTAFFRLHQLYQVDETGHVAELFVDGDDDFPYIDFGLGMNRRKISADDSYDDVPRRYPIRPLVVSAGSDGQFGLYTPDPENAQGDTPIEASKRRAMWSALQVDYRCGRVDARWWRQALDNILSGNPADSDESESRSKSFASQRGR